MRVTLRNVEDAAVEFLTLLTEADDVLWDPYGEYHADCESRLGVVTARACENILGHIPPRPLAKSEGPESAVTACIQIGGHWHGALMVSATQRFADYAAAKMLSLPTSLCGDTQTAHAMASLARIIGGEFLSYLPVNGSCQLSAASILKESDHSARICDGSMINQVRVNYGGSEVIVSLLADSESRLAA